ncbi:MAG: chemotaxis protein CheB, partial [Desulfobacteraceae bacterium]
AARSIPDVAVVGGVRSMGMLKVKLKHHSLDLVILDIDSEEMGGVDLIDTIRQVHADTRIVVVSDPKRSDPDLAVKALEKGVHCCITKPGKTRPASYNDFRLQLITIAGLLKSRKSFSGRKAGEARQDRVSISDRNNRAEENKTGTDPCSRTAFQKTAARITRVNVVVIASSTGGPRALMEIVPRLPLDLGVPVLVVQHMPSHMTGSFARSLDARSAITVCEAEEGEQIFDSRVYIAPGGRHMGVTAEDGDKRRFITLSDDPPENSVRPAADFLFRSVAGSYNGGILAVVLTGMGDDGRKGVQAMKEKGCLCFSQSAETCVIYGMPRAVESAGLSDESLAIDCLALRIVSAVKKGELH